MEDNQYPTVVRNSGLKTFLGILAAFLVMIAACAMVFFNHDSIAEIVEPEGETVCLDTVHASVAVPTIQEILKFRETVKEGIRIDSIFLAMPEAILIDILMTHGTSLSNSDIVYIYESNKEHFKDVLKGAVIQRDIITPMDSVKNPRDSLRRQRVIIKTSYYSFLKHFAQKWFKNFDTTSLFVRIDQSSEDDKPVGRKQICLVKRIRPT